MPAKTAQSASKTPAPEPRVRATRGRTAQSGAAEPTGIPVMNIREARSNLPQIVSLVASGAYGGVMIGRRGEPTAAIIPSDLATALLEPGDTKRTWAAIIVARLLGGAPPHLKAPALEELSRLPKTDLDRLLGIERLPLTKSQSATLQAKLAHPEALARLVKRFELATAIRKAREIGLYEVAEDAMSSLIGVAGETSGGS